MNNLLKKTAYTLLNWVTLGKGVMRKINGMKIRFPARWYRYYPVDYEQDNYTFLQQQVKPGMQVIDIGGHIGLFSVCSSKLAGPQGKVISFEPTPGTFSLFKQTIKLNRCTNVTAVQAAVSDKEGTATFYISNNDEACNSNSLVKHKSGNEQSGYEVKLTTIENVVATYALKPSLIKIDAEGTELDVLKGGTRVFKEHKPILILGLHPAFIKQKGDSLEAIWDLLQEHNYKIEMDGKPLSKQDFCSHDLLFDVHCL